MKKSGVFLILMSSLIASQIVQADEQKSKSSDLIKYRQSAMMFMRWNMGVIKKQAIIKPVTFKRKEVVAAANVISSIASSNIHKLYTEETGSGKGWKNTRVKNSYFYNTEDVNEKTFNFIASSNKLVDAAKNEKPSAIAIQFKQVLNSCKSCHKAYRAKM